MNFSCNSIMLYCLAATYATADTTFLNTDKDAWAANTGWISFRHDQPSSPEGVVFGESFLAGFAYSANTGWINLGDGTPSNGYSYSNTAADYGVNHDGAGNLSGFAWAANTGWVNFGWAASADSNRPRVNLITGAFSGYAWSANTGWVNLGSGLLTTASMDCPDTDTDDMADHWEWANFGGLGVATALTDTDGDGVLDKDEYAAGTDPNDNDSYFNIVSVSYNAGFTQSTLEFTSTPTRIYRIEFDDDLGIEPVGTWTNSSFGTFAPDVGATTTKVVTFPTGSKNFFRVEAIRPLSVGP